MQNDLRHWMTLTETLVPDEHNSARLARARQMGFDTTQVFYHATTADFQQFELDRAGHSNTIGQDEPAIFLTDDPGTANSYIPTQFVAGWQDGWSRERHDDAERRMHALFRQAHKPLSGDQGPIAQQLAVRREAEAEANAIINDLRASRTAPSAVHQTGSNIMPVFIKTKRLLTIDMGGGQYDPATVVQYLRKAKQRKKDGVMFLNFYDWGGAPGTLSRPHTTVAMFDPRNVRSIFAKFDPAKANSAKLDEAMCDDGILEHAIRVEANNEQFAVLINPSASQIVNLFERSRTDVLKGVIVEQTMYWWDAFYAHHGHILELFDPKYPAPYEVNGVDCRMIINMECDDRPTLDCADGLLENPLLQRVLASNLIWFLVPGAGCMVYDQYQRFRAGKRDWWKP